MENKLELGKTYNFVGYRWVPVRINEEDQVAIMQSLGVTSGPWPGYSMSQFGNGYYCSQNISSIDISDYDEKTRALMEQIRPIVSGDTGLYLPSYKNIMDNSVWRDALAKAAANYRSFGASSNYAWTGTFYGNYGAWVVCSNGSTVNYDQNDSYVIPVAFNLDLSKIEIKGDEIVIKKEFRLPYIVAYDIKWDTDGDPVLDQLPEEIEIPIDVLADDDEDAISDYLSDQTGFCHGGCKLAIKLRGKNIPYIVNWLDEVTFQFMTGDGYLQDSEGDDYIIKFEYHLDEKEFVVEIIWEDDSSVIEGIGNVDDYLTAEEIDAVEEIVKAMIQVDIEEYDSEKALDEAETKVEDAEKPRYLDVKVPGGILRARACIDLDYPGMDIEFIPDEKGGNVNAVSLPRVLIEKPVDNGKLRAIVWSDELKEDPTLKVEFL